MGVPLLQAPVTAGAPLFHNATTNGNPAASNDLPCTGYPPIPTIRKHALPPPLSRVPLPTHQHPPTLPQSRPTYPTLPSAGDTSDIYFEDIVPYLTP